MALQRSVWSLKLPNSVVTASAWQRWWHCIGKPGRGLPSTTSAPVTRNWIGYWRCNQTSSSWTCVYSRQRHGEAPAVVVKALALMAEKTGCWIIAEGVETEAELHFALECGSRYVQGFLFAQGQIDFFKADAFTQQFAQLRDHYVLHKLAERGRLMALRKQLSKLMNLLQAWAQGQAPLAALPQFHDYPWLLRFYQCDRHGTQLTPNLEWRNGQWQADASYLGHNWSWRPYFYHLLAEGWHERRLTLSNTYRDATSNQYCLTAGQFFQNGERLLLIDIDAAWL